MVSPRFVGRRAELGALREAFDRAAGRAGSVVLVGGEAGIGKSRLVAKLAAQARRDAATVLTGECLRLGEGELLNAQMLMLCHRVAESERRCEEALAIAYELRARHVQANVLNTMCANFSHAGQPERGVEAAARARVIARELGLIDEIALRGEGPGHVDAGCLAAARRD